MIAGIKLEKILRSYFSFGFHLSRKALEWFDLPSLLAASKPTVSGTNIYLLRQMADRYNEKQFHGIHTTGPIQPGQLITVEAIVDVLRYLIYLYCQRQLPGVILKGFVWTGEVKGTAIINTPPPSFISLYPPQANPVDAENPDEFLRRSSDVATNKEIVVGEMILLSLAMVNPAFRPFRGLFDDDDLRRQSPYIALIGAMEEYMGRQPVFSELDMPLFQCLRAPMEAAPDSLEGQLEYIKKYWARFLPDELLEKLLLASDILKEEITLRGFGPGTAPVLRFGKELYGAETFYSEPEAFSRDADWMSNVVLIAKSVYVWLDQLSKWYGRPIKLLSDIPDEELERLARWGFSGLWLIGVWERSPASKTIKQIMGNPEAASSAYSLYDCVIAADLGGEVAYQNLRDRAWKRGIRLASDMVPNHTGIYSRWVIEHPDWFLQLPYPPYPCYQYTGVDLSSDARVTVQIEDGYWQHRDAAVVFKRIDKLTGDVRFIYHGNDGTNMPWNDTAQLNFLIPEVREAVIQTILHVARQFSIIRFDAAMTLAKRHYQRLWFPQRGEGGAIPSRAEQGMTKAEFDAVFPREFWREVVDRVAAEVPETLLLAEAFWLMEGYFVRTLGMHRVYNSAFMNMLKMEDNAKYRLTIKNVLEFSPEVIKRFVNFMNNPDEKTAVEQFGKGDKYFGVALMMVTMPGLPMFGHGQIEGFTEKYGMEYQRAYWDETVDEEMVHRHEREIFPLMHRRRLFSGSVNFALYDFVSEQGWVDENVFAYSNRIDEERAVILYNNAYSTTSGRIHTSTAINVGAAEEPFLVRRTLAEALALNLSDKFLYSFRDFQSGLHYLRSGRQIADEGLFAVLHGYQYHAFLNFMEIYDEDGSWAELMRRLEGNGVPSLDETYREMKLEPIRIPFRNAINKEIIGELINNYEMSRSIYIENLSHFLRAAKDFSGSTVDSDAILEKIKTEMDILAPEIAAETRATKTTKRNRTPDPVIDNKSSGHIWPVYLTVKYLGEIISKKDSQESAAELTAKIIDEWRLNKIMSETYFALNGDSGQAYADSLLTAILAECGDFLADWTIEPDKSLMKLFNNRTIQEYLRMNKYNNVLWMGKEQLESLTRHLLISAEELAADKIKQLENRAKIILDAASESGYQVEACIELAEQFRSRIK
jgi:glycosidase